MSRKFYRLYSLTALLCAIIFLSGTRAVRAQAICNAPYLVEQSFPVGAPEQTRWSLCWQPQNQNGLVITAAYFRKSPGSPWIKVFHDARIAEIFVPYHDDSNRFYDVSLFNFPLIPLNANDCPASVGGSVIGGVVCKEVKDRGLLWKDDTVVKRGQQLVLWGALDAVNYNYIIEWTFRDDGVILGRLAATAVNYPGAETVPHMHGPVWRLDIDLNGSGGDSVGKSVHTETGKTASDTMTMITNESGIKWDPLAFNSLHISDSVLKNGRGSTTEYDLMPSREGTPRHDEPFTQNDFWVTKYKYGETLAPSLPKYISDPTAEAVSNTDIVVWYYSGLHHHPRDEDGQVVGDLWKGEALAMWTGFMLMPRNLFDTTPFFP
jgi:primary-amine oxidase